jgi:hypothetical protein
MTRRLFRLILLSLIGLSGAVLAAGDSSAPAGTVEAPPALQEHWAFQPVVRPQPPATNGRANTAVDRFIVAALEARGLTLSPEADRLTLVRRVSFDLTGLPPTPAEIDAFLADMRPDAYEHMVERYLASVHYGERWGKYWLDTVGYADSNGYFNADSDRPLAWRYRDYVIRAFNANKPYDRFLQEQLAGDELAGYRPGNDVTGETVELLTATHFLRNAPDGTGESDGNPDEVRTDRFTVLEGTLQITMNSLLGVTIQCARCHRHKFEPINHREYYQLQAVFYPAYNPARWTKPQDRVVPVGTRAELAAWQERAERIDREVKAERAKLAASAESLKDKLLLQRLVHLAPEMRDELLAAVKAPAQKRSPAQKALLKTHAQAVQIGDDELAKASPEYAALRKQVRETIAAREKERPRPPEKLSVFVETDPNPPAHHMLRGGRHNQPGEEVGPGVPAALCMGNNAYRIAARPAGQVSTGRRLALAHWVTAPENPLTARVMVNRIWQHHFGTGLVATPDNLGRSGATPTQPALLDYLAAEFVSSGWSVKAMHRLILRSAVYRQLGAPRAGLAGADPDNRLLGRFPLRRLDAEALRDAMLHVAGELDRRVGGPYVPSRRTPQGVVEVAENQDGARRRSVYLQQRRTQVVTLLQLFDAPSVVTGCSVRPTSTVPLQALALLNSDFARARARSFARRLDEAGSGAGGRLALAFRLAYGRPATTAQVEAAHRFLAAQRAVHAGRPAAEEQTWTDLCQMVLASNGFLYVD